MKLQELTKEEAEALTKDLQEVLAKHNCEMGVKSSIELLKRVEETPSPYLNGENDNTKEEKTD